MKLQMLNAHELFSVLAGTGLVLASLLGCGGASALTPLPEATPGPGTPIASGPTVADPAASESLDSLTAMLPQVDRLSAAGGVFQAECLGAEFADDLSSNLCVADGNQAQFSPAYIAGGSLDGAAYCLYRLSYDQAVSQSTLALSWDGMQPAVGESWIGLSNWGAGAWDWFAGSASLNITNPNAYSDGGNHMYAAIVLLGSTPASLASIGFPEKPLLTYPIVDTNQATGYDDMGLVINPAQGSAYYGMDAQYDGNQPQYVDNGDGTVTDLATGLMWVQTPNAMNKVTFANAFTVAENLTLAGHDDWRVPSIKELYSLIDFSGETGMSALEGTPFINTNYFDFEYGDEGAGERYIDAQYWSSTEYVSTTMGGSATTFGVNFADGRIKGYGREHPQGGEMEQFIRCVRGNPDYGVNSFSDNGDGTITDLATGLTWMQLDSGNLSAGPASDGTLNWEEALDWAEGLSYADATDWRLPNAKELQSLLDYTRSPATTGSAAIDPLFQCTAIIDEGGGSDYAFYWTSTTHRDGPPDQVGKRAAYVSFGEALGFMEQPPGSSNYTLLDVHGAGAQRSDPKDGNPADYPYGHGPQGDVIRIFNLVRCVRGSGLAE